MATTRQLKSGKWQVIIRKKNYPNLTKSFLSKDKLKYLKTKDKGSEIKLDYKEIKAPTYFPTNERMPETPPPNFKTPIDLDLFKGLGSFLVTTRKDYQK